MNRSNNDIMWTCMVDIFRGSRTFYSRVKVMDFLVSYVVHEGEEIEYNFSHDNWLAVFCWMRYFDSDVSYELPVFGKHSRHPMRFIMFAWMKYPYLLFPLRLITILDIIVKHGIIRRKTENGNYHTSGLLLSYYRAYSYNQKYTMWILTKLMKTMFKDWEEVFHKYHGDPESYNFKVLEAFEESNA